MRSFFDNGFRLTGLAVGGSTPPAFVCLIVLFLAVLVRFVSLKLLGHSSSDKENKNMGQRTNQLKLEGYSILETIWALGASGVVGSMRA